MDKRLEEILVPVKKHDSQGNPKEYIYLKGEILFCTGTGKAAEANNRGARLIIEGNYNEALKVFLESIKNASLFLPFRYNIGLVFLHLNKLDLALLNLEKVVGLLPEFWKTYLHIGYIYARKGRDDVAIEFYRNALSKNPNSLKGYTLIGNIYFKRNQMERAKTYYDAALTIDPKFPDGLLGLAKIHFKRKEYYRALIIIEMINLSADYDKSLHYYYAECAYKLRRYKTAYEQYAILLKFRRDKFFLTNSIELINHKLNLCKMLIER